MNSKHAVREIRTLAKGLLNVNSANENLQEDVTLPDQWSVKTGSTLLTFEQINTHSSFSTQTNIWMQIHKSHLRRVVWAFFSLFFFGMFSSLVFSLKMNFSLV